MAKKKSKGQIINRKTKDYKPSADTSAPFKSSGSHQFNPLRPKVAPSAHGDGKASAGGRQYTDTQRRAAGIGTPMGNFGNRPLNPKNAKDRKEIKRKLDYMYTHNTSGYANVNFNRTSNKEKFDKNYNEIDWGKEKKREEGRKTRKKY